ncbi:PHP domain-containing protein [Thermoanaerobacter sp. CM-CNRG TB177]|jgi:hypothetical protein|uniref:Polymerase/histidinol phosphatase N-terminal domain-containing protein n=2 Tax=Thermoanaerobacter TaxID=1754 RepID=A0ABT9M225_9THEO|nr:MULTISPECIES: PHP domain-containing protein [Thermoanaerobacter]ABY93642.1 phosphoesterase PHP domain protein [Thermoanaerobacter sp. X514]MBT1279376.1 PHP domain-containing protein [Thermoanaerobacter sp. CM-CNRG TB177]MDP9750165.1 hypothetical protein [Thermoanaerobacter pentosaceus]
MKKFLVVITILCLILGMVTTLGAQESNKEQNFIVVTSDRIRYEPNADSWNLGFSLLTVSDLKSKPILKSISVNGVDIKESLAVVPSEFPINKFKGLTTSQLKRWNELRKAYHKGTLNKDGLTEFRSLNQALKGAVEKAEGIVELKINPTKLPFSMEKGEIYPLQVEIQYGQEVQTFTTEVFIQSIPSDSSWIPAQLHVHSNFSDGKKTPQEIVNIYKGMGYKVVYITDHTDLIPQHGGWSSYSEAMANASSASGIPVYPGAEMTVVSSTGEVQGDLLAYGIVSLNGLENKTYSPQRGIDNIWGNSSLSSAAIAHPTGNPPWTDWSVVRYSGIELMSGYLQLKFDDGASPMVRWRSELTRLLPDAFNYIYRPSARTGDDWHAEFYEPNPEGYVTFINTSGSTSKFAVDSALLRGKTVASRDGGLGYFYFERNGTTKHIGETLTGVPANSRINIYLTFKPVNSGSYTIKIYKDNKISEIFSQTGSYSSGVTYNMSGSFIFDGGQHYYYLYISGPDYIYSTPIYVSN